MYAEIQVLKENEKEEDLKNDETEVGECPFAYEEKVPNACLSKWSWVDYSILKYTILQVWCIHNKNSWRQSEKKLAEIIIQSKMLRSFWDQWKTFVKSKNSMQDILWKRSQIKNVLPNVLQYNSVHVTLFDCLNISILFE